MDLEEFYDWTLFPSLIMDLCRFVQNKKALKMSFLLQRFTTPMRHMVEYERRLDLVHIAYNYHASKPLFGITKANFSV